MRTVLRLLGTRFGIAAVLLVLVLGVVGVGRIVAGSRPSEPIGPRVAPTSAPGQSPSADLESGSDSLVEPDESDAAPSLNTNTPAVSIVAAQFINAWLRHTGVTPDQWRAGLKPNATTQLMTELQDTDPGSVPADKVIGDIAAIDQGGSVWSAAVPVNGGTVILRLIPVRGHWQVDGIDWDPS